MTKLQIAMSYYSTLQKINPPPSSIYIPLPAQEYQRAIGMFFIWWELRDSRFIHATLEAS